MMKIDPHDIISGIISEITSFPRRHTDRIITALAEAGYQIVPIEPTDATLTGKMIEAFEKIGRMYESQNINHVDFRVGAKHLADAMLAVRAKVQS